MADESRENVGKGKRKRIGKAAKYALKSPYEPFRPVLNETQADKITGLLVSLLHREKVKPKLPWKNLIKLPKQVRKERIRELHEKNSTISEEIHEQRKHLKLGLNSVSRAISNGRLRCCLVAGDVPSDMLVIHLINLAVTRGIPSLVVPNLKKVTRRIIGFSCLALGLTTRIEEENHYLDPLSDEIIRVFSEFKRPPNYGCAIRQKEDIEKLTIRAKRSMADFKIRRKSNLFDSDVHQIEKPQTEDFIAFQKVTDSNISQPRIDLESVYMSPKFKKVPKNIDKLGRKGKKN